MSRFPYKLEKRLCNRKIQKSFREFGVRKDLIDFASNDYLGLAYSGELFQRASEICGNERLRNGSTGSRLLSGNHPLYQQAEDLLCDLHQTQAAVIYNSGYDANIGFFSCVPRKGDVVVFDELVHASIRDGISMSHARSLKYKHNDLEDLKAKIRRLKLSAESEIYIVTESIFSMDGDIPDLEALSEYAREHGFFLVVDEAHAVGVLGRNGEGLVLDLGIQEEVFARIITFGKAFGTHGAAVLGNQKLKDYLMNFSRSLIYTTALPPHSVAAIIAVHELFREKDAAGEPGLGALQALNANIQLFRSEVKRNNLHPFFINSFSAIHSCIIPGNERVKVIAKELGHNGYEVKPILAPTVPETKERLRFCLHSFNSPNEIREVLKVLAKFASS